MQLLATALATIVIPIKKTLDHGCSDVVRFLGGGENAWICPGWEWLSGASSQIQNLTTGHGCWRKPATIQWADGRPVVFAFGMRFMMLCSGLYEYRNMKWYTHVLSHLYLFIFQIIDILFIIYIFNILAKPQQRCSAKDFPRTLPRLACIRSTRIFTSNDQFQLSFLSYDILRS